MSGRSDVYTRRGVLRSAAAAVLCGTSVAPLATGCVVAPVTLPIEPPFDAPPPPTPQAPIPTRCVDLAALAAGVPADAVRGAPPPLVAPVFLGAFESSMHRRWDGERLDLIAATRHDAFAEADYRRLVEAGLSACRDATRWPRIERRPGRTALGSFLPMVRAARRAGIHVMWDLCHYGWPDHVDVFSPAFVTTFGRYARRIAEVLDGESGEVWICPINEISFLAWAAGDRRLMYPYAARRGLEMKRNLVRAACVAMGEVLDVCPRARLLLCDPVIHLAARPDHPEEAAVVQAYRDGQFQAWDWIAGRGEPDLGGDPRFLDVIGVNYYRNNQTFDDGTFIPGDHPLYRPLSLILGEVWERYRRPILVGETGIEDALRPAWLRYVAGEVGLAMHGGCGLHGIVWSPIVNHPGWDDARHCHNGLWDYPDRHGRRERYEPLMDTMWALAPYLLRLRAKAGLGGPGAGAPG
ncbi:MAG: beta-glucosidase [Pseudomonadota bacterium]|nr:beta-glucosidase [Pseudomonadota bacterium]